QQARNRPRKGKPSAQGKAVRGCIAIPERKRWRLRVSVPPYQELRAIVEVIQRELLRGDSRRYRRIRIPHSPLPSPVAPAPAELTYESLRFFGENLFAERPGGVTQFSAFSVQTADDTFDCFGPAKSLGRFPHT